MSSVPAAGLVFSLPIRTKNPNNNREHWRNVAARAKTQRAVAAHACRPKWNALLTRDPFVLLVGITITLTRVGPKGLDDDGNVASLKAVRDGIADAMRLKSDKDPRVSWVYGQRRGAYAVEVLFSERHHCATCGSLVSAKAFAEVAT